MPNMKDLGQDVKKSMDDMKKLRDCLKSFRDVSEKLKQGLKKKKVLDEDVSKKVNEAREQVTSLDNIVEAIMDGVREVKMDGNSRFMNKAASQRVIHNFLGRPR